MPRMVSKGDSWGDGDEDSTLSPPEREPVDKEENDNTFPREIRRGEGAKHESQWCKKRPTLVVVISFPEILGGEGGRSMNTLC